MTSNIEFKILNKKLETENIKLKEDCIKQICKIDELKELIYKESNKNKKRDDEQKKQFEELLEFIKTIKEQNENINNFHINLKEYLIEKLRFI
jgi:hypothetical protein